jgi:AcrR family transcriptional regulator
MTVEQALSGDAERPLRKDAERNRRRILDAARELFAQRGLAVTLNDVAHHAGVGVGTVYRRFPDRERLIDELFEERLDELVTRAAAAAEEQDPWKALTRLLETVLEIQANDRAIKELVFNAPGELARVTRIRARMLPIVTRVVQRARDSGQLRPDIEPADLPLLQLILGAVIDCARDVEPELWRRYLEIMLRGLRAEPPAPQPLPRPAPALAQAQRILETYRPPPR